MLQTPVLIIGASVSGLASAAALQQKGIPYIIIEKEDRVAQPWRNHYDRLHLHTPKNLSALPYKNFKRSLPRYPSRQQVVNYLEDYQKAFSIRPVFNTAAASIKKENGYWITETVNGIYRSDFLIMATGAFSRPRPIDFPGMETFTGKILHSQAYKTGLAFKGQKVLVIGFGNSACEIAMDLYEQDAAPSMAVRSPVNIIPRDLLGVPIVRLGILLSRLPAGLADWITAPLTRWLFGDLRKLGLQKLKEGPFQQIKNRRNTPLIDTGTVAGIRRGHIKIQGNICGATGTTVYFEGGEKDDFDAIVAAIGYSSVDTRLLDAGPERLADLQKSTAKQAYFGRDGLYFCGFWVGPTGQFREIASDAKRIAAAIALKKDQ